MKYLLLFFILTVGCQSNCNNPKDPTIDSASCPSVCTHFRKLGCDEGKPTAKGATCEEVCTNMQESKLLPYDLKCAGNVTTCEGISHCQGKRN